MELPTCSCSVFFLRLKKRNVCILNMFQRKWNLRICSLSPKKQPTFWWTDEIFWFLQAILKGDLWCLEKNIWWQQIDKGRSHGGILETFLWKKTSRPFGLISSIISNDVTVNGGLGSRSSRNDPTFQVYEWLECIQICPVHRSWCFNRRHSLRCEYEGSNYIKPTSLKP